MAKVGILYDNISGNTGDVAIGLSVKKILREIGVEFDELVPGNFNPNDYETIIIGGGHLIRPSPDFFYDKFKVPGKHILNAVGILDSPDDLHYLNDYKYVTVRTSWDKERLSYLEKDVHVIPCTTMLLEDLKDIPLTPKSPSLGIHLFSNIFNEDEEKQFVDWASSLPFTVYLIPITHYKQDYIYLGRLGSMIKNSVLLPIMKPLEIFTFIGRLDYFISCSLHGGIFSYIHNVPFILFNYNEKMFFFMKDRELQQYTFTNYQSMRMSFDDLLSDTPDYSEKISKDLDLLKLHVQFLKQILPSGEMSQEKTTDLVVQTNHQIHLLQSQARNHETKLRQYEAKAQEAEKMSADQGIQIMALTSRTQALDQSLIERDCQIAAMSDQIKHAKALAEALNSEIAEMRRSVIWQLTMRFHSAFIERALPHATRRRSMYNRCLIKSRILVNDGPKLLKKQFYKITSNKNIDKDDSEEHLSKFDPSQDELSIMREECKSFKYRPKISIIIPVWNTEEKWLDSAINSVLSQAYENWELCIVDDASTMHDIKGILETYSKKDERIKVKFLDKNLGISGASNEAMSFATGEFIGFLDHDDKLISSALYQIVKHLNDNLSTDFIYSDEVIMAEDGKPIYALFRPDFSLDFLLSHCYIVHFVVIRSEIIKKINGFRKEFDVSQDYDLFLRVLSETRNVYHIPNILYKWRQHCSSTGHTLQQKVMDLSMKAIKDFLDRECVVGEVHGGEHFNFFRTKRKIIGCPKVTIIIPTKDKVDLLRKCIESIENNTSYKNYEVIIIDNQSHENETKIYLDDLPKKYDNYSVIKFEEKFNYSKMNNFAVRYSKGIHLLFLNNDVEVKSSEWIEALLEHSQRQEVACVGAKLLYPDNKIQHVGVAVGFFGCAEHIYKFADSNDIGYMGQFISIRNCSAVTAACMMVKRDVFDELNGFDENMKVGFGDTDFCMRAVEKGYLNVFTPYAELYHYESATRGKSVIDPHPEDSIYFKSRWHEFILKGDPYYNPNLPKRDFDITPCVEFK